jgi:hypothetical protein
MARAAPGIGVGILSDLLDVVVNGLRVAWRRLRVKGKPSNGIVGELKG